MWIVSRNGSFALVIVSAASGCGSTGGLPRDVPITKVSTDAILAAGDHQTCVLQTDGKPVCWPLGSIYGKSSPTSTKPPVPVASVKEAMLLAAGGDHACVVGRDGSITCWEVGLDGKMEEPKPFSLFEKMGPPVAMDVYGRVAGFYGCVVDATGNVGCFSDGLGPLPDNPPKDIRLTSLSGGEEHACGIDQDKHVVCWGNNESGQLGQESFAGGVVAGLDKVAEVAVGSAHTCARKESGHVACWGSNEFGQLGGGTTGGKQSTPRDVVGVDDAIAIAAGASHSCAVRRSGKLSCWGRNLGGGLTDGSTTDRNAPVDAPLVTDAIKVVAGFYQTCALRRSGKITCWGLGETQGASIDLTTGQVTEKND